MKRTRFQLRLRLALLTLLLFAAVLLEITLGQYPISVANVLRDSYNYLKGSHSVDAVVMGAIRWPRMWVASCVGAGLASAGAALQAIFRNPMTDPSILGVSSGASLGAVLSITTGIGAVSLLVTPLCAFFSAVIVVGVIYRLGTVRKVTAVHTLLLAGVAVSSACGAVVTLLLTLSPLTTMQQILFWLMGGLDGSTWTHVELVLPSVAAGIAILLLYNRELDNLGIGEDHAAGVGVSVQRTKQIVLCTTALMVAACVSVSGVIAFVGLIVPHMMRSWLDVRHSILLPACALGGATLTIFADVLARMVVSPVELNIGVVTACMGTPFFLVLLRRQSEIHPYDK